MKVALVINELNIRGGTHKQFLKLCQYCEKQRIEFDIYTKFYDPQKTYPDFSKYHINYLKAESNDSFSDSLPQKIKRKIDKLTTDWNLYQIIKKNEYDIINIHDNGLSYFTTWCSIGTKAKIVWQINDLPMCFNVGSSTHSNTSIKERMHCKLYRKLAKKVDLITVNVSKNKNRVNKHLKKNAEVLFCGVDKNDSLSTHAFKEKESISILSSGVFFPYRNYETQIFVVKQLKDKGFSVHLDIIGSTELDKSYAAKIDNLIVQNDLAKEIKIWGQVDEYTYTELHNKADIFCFINVDQSWGLAVFEAMSCGLPVIVSNSVGATEILNDGIDSVFSDPFDVDHISQIIIDLHNKEEYYNRISTNAKNAVSQMSWDNMYSSKIVKLFYELIQE